MRPRIHWHVEQLWENPCTGRQTKVQLAKAYVRQDSAERAAAAYERVRENGDHGIASWVVPCGPDA